MRKEKSIYCSNGCAEFEPLLNSVKIKANLEHFNLGEEINYI